MSSQTQRVRNRAFTIVELLIVISILVILMAILLPAIGRARSQARTTVCASNLHHLFLAAQMYSSTNNGFVVPGYYWLGLNTDGVNFGNGTVSGRVTNMQPPAQASQYNTDKENYASILVYTDCISIPLIQTGNATPNNPPSTSGSILYCPEGITDTTSALPPFRFNPYAPVAPPLRTSPQASVPWRVDSELLTLSKGTPTSVDTWYGINAADVNPYSLQNCQAPAWRIPDATDSSIGQLFSEITNPSRIVLFYDGIFQLGGEFNSVTNSESTNSPYHYATGIAARHGGGKYVNLCFADGHVETANIADIPGGITQTATGSFPFASATTLNNPANHENKYDWRMDQ